MARSIWTRGGFAVFAGLALAVVATGPTRAQPTPAAAAKKVAAQHEEELRKGLAPEAAVVAIEALGAIGAPASSEVIAPYVQHRAAGVRRAAALALGRTKGPKAAAALLAGLRSSDPVVRSVAAAGLQWTGDRDSAPDLLRALDRGVTEAAPSIGAVCAGADCDGLVQRFQKLSADARKAALEAMLQRKPALPDDVLLSAVDRVRAAEGAAGKAYFAALKASFKGSKKVKKALEEAARAPSEAKP